ncbi:MAG: substrate-binding domain-containing protein [Deltaproteobacteria bacterium]|nr:MAG: substrate-binding domain-containing protein [Deltaproteobacteria bacterium]
MRRSLAPVLALLAALGSGASPRAEPPETTLLLATTTSVRDCGLLDELLPIFREQHGIHAKVIAVGTGAALRMGAEGNADVLITHAPEAEAALVESGAARARVPFMENHFVLAGPPEDTARAREAPSILEALRRIRAANAAFVSRGDDSGTHKREAALLSAAGLPTQPDWEAALRTGSGMGLALQVAGERRAYVLSDIGTFLAFQARTGLAVLSRPEPELRNVYSVLRIDPARFPKVRAAPARALETFLIGPEAQRRIAAFGVERYGRPLFRPIADPHSGD